MCFLDVLKNMSSRICLMFMYSVFAERLGSLHLDFNILKQKKVGLLYKQNQRVGKILIKT